MNSIERKGFAFMLLGLALQAASIRLASVHEPIARALGFVSAAALVYGGVVTVRERGYTPWIGFCALFSFLGVCMIMLLPEPHEKAFIKYLAARREEPSDAKP